MINDQDNIKGRWNFNELLNEGWQELGGDEEIIVDEHDTEMQEPNLGEIEKVAPN